MTAPFTPRETKVRPGVTLRGRGALPTLALMLALAALGGCSFEPSTPMEWREVAYASADAGLHIYQDGAGCYWLHSGGQMRPLLKLPALPGTAPDPQWCEAARATGPASPLGNSGRDQ